MKIARPILGLALAAAFGPVPAAEFDSGLAAYRTGDHGQAHDHWRVCALAGQARCQFALGTLYDDGKGIERDTETALTWYRQAAIQDFPDALMQLGFLFATGREDFEQDPVRAWAWFSRAAGLGVPGAARHRDQVGELLSPEELSNAQRLAVEISIRYHLQSD